MAPTWPSTYWFLQNHFLSFFSRKASEIWLNWSEFSLIHEGSPLPAASSPLFSCTLSPNSAAGTHHFREYRSAPHPWGKESRTRLDTPPPPSACLRSSGWRWRWRFGELWCVPRPGWRGWAAEQRAWHLHQLRRPAEEERRISKQREICSKILKKKNPKQMNGWSSYLSSKVGIAFYMSFQDDWEICALFTSFQLSIGIGRASCQAIDSTSWGLLADVTLENFMSKHHNDRWSFMGRSTIRFRARTVATMHRSHCWRKMLVQISIIDIALRAIPAFKS